MTPEEGREPEWVVDTPRVSLVQTRFSSPGSRRALSFPTKEKVFSPGTRRAFSFQTQKKLFFCSNAKGAPLPKELNGRELPVG